MSWLDRSVLRYGQVLILSRQNQGLRDGIDAVETEMALLHDVIQTKDSKLQKLKRESDRFRREINRLHVSSSNPTTHFQHTLSIAFQHHINCLCYWFATLLYTVRGTALPGYCFASLKQLY